MTKYLLFLLPVLMFAGYNLEAQESMKVFQNGNDQLVIYTDVPGLPPSEFYKVRVRSSATNNKWQESFALVTRSLCAQAMAESGDDENYLSHLRIGVIPIPILK